MSERVREGGREGGRVSKGASFERLYARDGSCFLGVGWLKITRVCAYALHGKPNAAAVAASCARARAHTHTHTPGFLGESI